MFEYIKYRWALRKALKEHVQYRRMFTEMPEDDPENHPDEPREKWVVGRELQWMEFSIASARSKYLIEQAYKYHVPLPEDEASWEQGTHTDEMYLTAAAAQKLRADIRAEQKADWDYWAARVTLALALIGSIFGVLAYFKK